MTKHLDRRSALLGGISALGALALHPSRTHAAVRLQASQPLPQDGPPRTLLVLQLAGGNDGLSTVVPYADDTYHAARPATAIARDAVLALDDYRGLNPELERLRERYEAGQLAIVEGAGYPDPIRSHFKSFDVWHTADPRGRGVPEGWLGRLARAVSEGSTDPNLCVHVGGAVPYSLHSATHPPVSFATPTGYRWAGTEAEREAFEQAAAKATYGEERPPDDRLARRDDEGREVSNLEFLRQVLADGQRSSAAIRRAAALYRTPVEYPSDALGTALRDIAALIHGDVGSRILSCELGGFDTHTDLTARHTRLMAQLDAALGAFLADLERSEPGRECVVLVFSEFGRRVAENGARGNDHGTAGPMFLAGPAVKGGLHGAHPSLTDLDNGDLRFTTDFRAVYATVIERWFGVKHQRVLGKHFELLPLLPA
jgi:uncharacterized protein (DUF1501 family)